MNKVIRVLSCPQMRTSAYGRQIIQKYVGCEEVTRSSIIIDGKEVAFPVPEPRSVMKFLDSIGKM